MYSLIFNFFVQALLPESKEDVEGEDRKGDQTACRCCQTNEEEIGSRELRQEVGRRDTAKEGRGQILCHVKCCLSGTIEHAGQTEGDACKYSIDTVCLHVKAYQLHNTFIFREEARQDIWPDQTEGHEADRNSKADQDCRHNRLFRTLRLPCANVLCNDDREGLTEGTVWQEGKIDDLITNPHCCTGGKSHGIDDRSNEHKADIDQDTLKSQRNTDLEHLGSDSCIEANAFAGEREGKTGFHNIEQSEDKTDALRCDCCDRNAGGAQRNHFGKENISDNIDDGGDKNEEQRTLAVADRTKQGADDIVSDDQRNTKAADLHITMGFAHCRFRYIKKIQKYRIAPANDQHQNNTDHGEVNDHIAHDFGGFFMIFCADTLADQDRTSVGKSDGQIGYSPKDLCSGGYCGKTLCGAEISDCKCIDCSIQGLQKRRQKKGNRESDQS